MEHSSTVVLRGLKKENRAPFKDSVLKESRRATLRITIRALQHGKGYYKGDKDLLERLREGLLPKAS